MDNELPEITADLKNPRSHLFMALCYYTAGNWELEDIYTAMEWLAEWEGESGKPPLTRVK